MNLCPPTTPSWYRYQAYGLTIASELPCPELLPGTGPPQVSFRYGQVVAPPAPVRPLAGLLRSERGDFLLQIQGVATYRIIAGTQIIVEPAPGAGNHEVRLFLLGSALGALLQQRGRLPLHGSAVEIQGGAAVFLGFPGSGKSTLAGALHQRGHRVLADDVAALSFHPSSPPQVARSYPWLKLGADVLRRLGQDPASRSLSRVGKAKFGLPLAEAGFAAGPAPLLRVYELTVSPSPGLELTPLQGWDKLMVFLRHTYRPQFLPWTLGLKRHWKQCLLACRHVRVSRLRRSREGWSLTELVQHLEADWRGGRDCREDFLPANHILRKPAASEEEGKGIWKPPLT